MSRAGDAVMVETMGGREDGAGHAKMAEVKKESYFSQTCKTNPSSD